MAPLSQKIAIAVVESEGHFLIGTRPDDVPSGGKDEFPGGKCESDEPPQACAVRECREETGLLVIPVSHLLTKTHEYDHGSVELHFWRCSLSPDQPERAAPRSPFRWVEAGCLSELNFPDANDEVLELLTR